MEDLVPSSLQERKSTATKKTKSKKKPVKVVYISNPMKFKINASEFRSLVQELTGQDAEFPDPTKFLDNNNHVGPNQTVQDASKTLDDDDDGDFDDDDPAHAIQLPTVDPPSPENHGRKDASFDSTFDDVLLDNFSGLIPSSLFCDYSCGYA